MHRLSTRLMFMPQLIIRNDVPLLRKCNLPHLLESMQLSVQKLLEHALSWRINFGLFDAIVVIV